MQESILNSWCIRLSSWLRHRTNLPFLQIFKTTLWIWISISFKPSLRSSMYKAQKTSTKRFNATLLKSSTNKLLNLMMNQQQNLPKLTTSLDIWVNLCPTIVKLFQKTQSKPKRANLKWNSEEQRRIPNQRTKREDIFKLDSFHIVFLLLNLNLNVKTRKFKLNYFFFFPFFNLIFPLFL